jgi:DNA repair exonuclease SbcCD ATPase subunit
MSTYNTEEIIKSSMENVKTLNKKLNDIEELHNQIKQSIADSAKIPVLFEKLGIELNNSTESYLSGNNKIFKDSIEEIIVKTLELKTEINRLAETDFTSQFLGLQTKFLETTGVELKKKFDKLDEKTNKLKTVNNDFKNEVTRLSKIELESHFDKHQSKLSDIFNAINGINNVLSVVSQNLIKNTQGLGEIEQRLKANHNDIKQKFENVSSDLKKQKEYLEEKLNQVDTILEKVVTQNQQINEKLETTSNKQQTNTYITWGLIVLAVIVIILMRK